MSDKRPRRAIGRMAAGAVIGVLLATLILVVLNRRDSGSSTLAAAPSPVVPAPTLAPKAVLQGVYDVTLTVVSVEYGSTWPATSPQLTPGQSAAQRWLIDCTASACAISVTTGHIAEDPDRATVSTADGSQFAVSGTQPASPDGPDLPVGCGTVNAIDVQEMTLQAVSQGGSFSGRYSVHHPTIHVEGPAGPGTGSCDSFNAVLDIAGTRG